MNNIITYIKESFQEVIYNVTWPEYKELNKSTATVIVASIAFAVVIAVVDYLFKEGLGVIYSL